MQIGIAGTGKMGAAIAARLMEVGHTVTVWNRTPDKAKAIAGAQVAATPTALGRQLRSHHLHSHRRRGDRCGLQRARRPAQRRRAQQAVHRDEHGAPGGRDRTRRGGAPQGCGVCRVSGQRLDRAGAAGQTARPRGRRAWRCSARAADPRTAVPPHRARRAGRLRRAAEIHRQYAADDLLAGARRGAGIDALARYRSGAC